MHDATCFRDTAHTSEPDGTITHDARRSRTQDHICYNDKSAVEDTLTHNDALRGTYGSSTRGKRGTPTSKSTSRIVMKTDASDETTRTKTTCELPVKTGSGEGVLWMSGSNKKLEHRQRNRRHGWRLKRET
ncbi:hypothetical protein FKP32DRAFT_161923 [Trametes sanguinea]|nr:hypothetical protein FKP32DRAFT_161923 [Trametes sanguinea]